MQPNSLSGGQELICINVDKVYDWIVKERSFDVTAPGTITFTPAASVPPGSITDAQISCEVTPDLTNPIVILGREDRPFIIDGVPVTLQQVNIQKNFIVTICVITSTGVVLTSTTPIPVTRCEQVTLCAPDGTDIEITYTDLDCFICSTGTLTGGTAGTAAAGTITFSGLTISVVSCQSIQSTFPVTVEFLAEFCGPRDEFPIPCPAPIRPLQCPAVFPSVGTGTNG
jgi:hypothetical protein